MNAHLFDSGGTSIAGDHLKKLFGLSVTRRCSTGILRKNGCRGSGFGHQNQNKAKVSRMLLTQANPRVCPLWSIYGME